MFRLALIAAALYLIAPASFSLLPSGPADRSYTIGDLIVAGEQLVEDAGTFCERNPEVCDTVSKMGSKARDRAAEMTARIQTWLEDNRES